MFDARELAICGLFGGLTFLEGYLLGTAVISMTGIPATGSLFNMFLGLLLFSIGVKLVPKFGSATIIATIEGILTIPTAINGPPGVQKVLMLFFLGLVFDIIVHMTRRKNWGFALGGGIGAAGIVGFIYLELLLLQLPGLAGLQAILIPLIIANLALGSFGAYAGAIIFDRRLSGKSFIRSMGR